MIGVFELEIPEGSDSAYTILGFTFVQICRFEHALDRAIRCSLRSHRAEALQISRRFPIRLRDKLHFLRSLLEMLGGTPFSDDFMTHAETAIEFRNDLFHGGVKYLSFDLEKGRWRYYFEKLELNRKGREQTISYKRSRVGDVYLVDLSLNCDRLIGEVWERFPEAEHVDWTIEELEAQL